MTEALKRTEMLLGTAAMERLNRSRVAVFGLGGVGGYAVEALARCGVGALDLIDHDTISESNLNRQILATTDTLGLRKVDAAAARIASIRPECIVRTYPIFYLPDTANSFDFKQYDYIVDAIDTVTGKLMLAAKAQEQETPIISAMGTGNKLDPTAFTVADIYQTEGCPLARIMRRECRQRGIKKLKVVYSKELPRRPASGRLSAPTDGKRQRDIPGSVSFVPAVAGMILAGEVVRDLLAADYPDTI